MRALIYVFYTYSYRWSDRGTSGRPEGGSNPPPQKKKNDNGRHFADDVLKCIFLNENMWILLKISLKFVPKGPINIIPSLVQKMAWRRPGDKPLSEPMKVSILTHICVTRPQWVKSSPCSNPNPIRWWPQFWLIILCANVVSHRDLIFFHQPSNF